MKRILAFLLGGISLVCCVYAAGMSYLLAHEFIRDGGPLWEYLAATTIPAAMCFAAGALGIRLLRFAVIGRSQRLGLLGDVLLGLGCFFPGVLVSLPLTMISAVQFWPGNGRAELIAGIVTGGVGIACAAVGVFYFVKKRKSRARSPQPLANSLSGPESNFTSES